MTDYPDAPPPDLDELKLALQQSPLLRGLMEVAPDIMQQTLKTESVPANTVLFREGDAADKAYVIWSGKLRIQHELGQGQQPLLMRECEPGDVVGEVSLFDNQPRSASVIATEDSRLITLSRDDLHHLLQEKPEAAILLLQTLSYRLRTSDEILIQASHSVDFLSRRLAGVDDYEDQIKSAIQAEQWGGLSRFVSEMFFATVGLRDGIRLLKRQLAASGMTDDVRDTVNLLEAHNDRVLRGVERVRLVDVLQSGEFELDLKPTMIGAMTERLSAHMASAAREQSLSIGLSVEDGLPDVWADEELVTEALTELLRNAMRLSAPGREVMLRVTRASLDEVSISVEDEGPGIPEGYRDLIFEPFVRLPGEGGQRAGMGLAFVKAVVDVHEGRVEVHEPEDEHGGVTIVIILPVRPSIVDE